MQGRSVERKLVSKPLGVTSQKLVEGVHVDRAGGSSPVTEQDVSTVSVGVGGRAGGVADVTELLLAFNRSVDDVVKCCKKRNCTKLG